MRGLKAPPLGVSSKCAVCGRELDFLYEDKTGDLFERCGSLPHTGSAVRPVKNWVRGFDDPVRGRMDNPTREERNGLR